PLKPLALVSRAAARRVDSLNGVARSRPPITHLTEQDGSDSGRGCDDPSVLKGSLDEVRLDARPVRPPQVPVNNRVVAFVAFDNVALVSARFWQATNAISRKPFGETWPRRCARAPEREECKSDAQRLHDEHTPIPRALPSSCSPRRCAGRLAL